MRHGTKVVHLRGLYCGNDGNEIGGIAQVTIVQKQLDTCFMPIAVQMINAAGVETGGAADNAVDLCVVCMRVRCLCVYALTNKVNVCERERELQSQQEQQLLNKNIKTSKRTNKQTRTFISLSDYHQQTCLVAFSQQEFRQIRTVLARNAGNQCHVLLFFRHLLSSFFLSCLSRVRFVRALDRFE
jgi:hypothetical protein